MDLFPHRHSCTVLLAGGLGGLVVVERPRLRDRLLARLRARRLDRALAEGTPPEASAALALRAERLTELYWRRSIASGLRRILRDAGGSRRLALAKVTPNRSAIRAASGELSLLADTLDDPGPVAAHGVAQAWLLLADGTGPLYNPQAARSLRAGADRAVRELRPWAAA